MDMVKYCFVAAVAALGLQAAAGVVKVRSSQPIGDIYVQTASLERFGTDAFRGIPVDTLSLTGGECEIAVDFENGGACRVDGPGVYGSATVLIAAPDETITATFGPDGATSVAGSELMEEASAVIGRINPMYARMRQLPDENAQTELLNQIRAICSDAFLANLDRPVGLYLMTMTPNAVVTANFDKIGDEAIESVLEPVYDARFKAIERQRAIKAARGHVEVGEAAPDFKLKDTSGREVTLESLRGNWVMLDFWGSWCIWCVRGIPEMKQEYARLGDRCKFVSISCRDSKDAWLDAVKGYGLDWINLWSDPALPAAEAPEARYGVTGFPTKMIIDPEGKIAEICVGEQPGFYQKLEALMSATQ